MSFTERQLKIMRAAHASNFNGSAGLDAITRAAGLKQAHRLGVRKTLLSLLRIEKKDVTQYGEHGKYIFRIAPENQWSLEFWGLTNAGREAIGASDE